jgi:uroporphyrinogen-III synthase
MVKDKQVLFLNHVDQEILKNHNKILDIHFSSCPLIKTIPINRNITEINNTLPWVFTSQKAVECMQGSLFPEKIYAIGERTAAKLPHAMLPKVATARQLADLIKDNNEQEILFICGNKRRELLPQQLKSYGINVKEEVVYRTEILQKYVNLDSIDGLIFMSPSSVESLALNGGFQNLPTFAIGSTTAQALKEHGQKAIISNESSIQSLINTVNKYFH